MGGMTQWDVNGSTTVPSYSPIKFANSKSWWVLAADPLVRGTSWGSLQGQLVDNIPIWNDLPPHRNSGSKAPAGANEVMADGSAGWYKYSTMSMFHAYTGNGIRQFFWYQNPADFSAQMLGLLPAAAAANYPN
jgi:hypothetical protein